MLLSEIKEKLPSQKLKEILLPHFVAHYNKELQKVQRLFDKSPKDAYYKYLYAHYVKLETTYTQVPLTSIQDTIDFLTGIKEDGDLECTIEGDADDWDAGCVATLNVVTYRYRIDKNRFQSLIHYNVDRVVWALRNQPHYKKTREIHYPLFLKLYQP